MKLAAAPSFEKFASTRGLCELPKRLESVTRTLEFTNARGVPAPQTARLLGSAAMIHVS